MKKIALDLDGVVFDSENLYRVITEIYDTDTFKKDTVVDNTQRLFQKRYNWSNEVVKKVYEECFEQTLSTCHFMTGFELVYNKLKVMFSFLIVTSRTDCETEIAKKKLKEIGLDNIPIFNKEHTKVERFIKEKVDYIIDDDEEICISAANNNIHALYFKNNAANRIDKLRVINVNNWGEIYKYLILKEYPSKEE